MSGQPNSKPYSVGEAVFYGSIPRSALEADSVLDSYNKGHGITVWSDCDRKIVMYSCDKEELHFVCIHPEVESGGKGNGNYDLL